MGGVESILAGMEEPSVRYHSGNVRFLTLNHDLVKEQFQAGSLTGAVASQMVTEAYKGFLGTCRNRI